VPKPLVPLRTDLDARIVCRMGILDDAAPALGRALRAALGEAELPIGVTLKVEA
jgi:hypothetical protein